jgi:lactococcin 972 family bacteriocin
MRRRLIVLPVTAALMLSTAAPALAFSTLHPGGGTWTYGTETSWTGTKHVMSHYFHATKFHSATTANRTASVKRVYGDAGNWANSDQYFGPLAAGKAYWATY